MVSIPRTLDEAAYSPQDALWVKQQRQRMQLVSNLDRYLVFNSDAKGKVCSLVEERLLTSGL
jgi:hypothetical protein